MLGKRKCIQIDIEAEKENQQNNIKTNKKQWLSHCLIEASYSAVVSPLYITALKWLMNRSGVSVYK